MNEYTAFTIVLCALIASMAYIATSGNGANENDRELVRRCYWQTAVVVEEYQDISSFKITETEVECPPERIDQ